MRRAVRSTGPLSGRNLQAERGSVNVAARAKRLEKAAFRALADLPHRSDTLPPPPSKTALSGRLRTAAVPALLAFLYLWPFPHFEFLRSPNELSRLYQVRALVDDGTPAVNGPVARYGPMGDLSEIDGRLYPNKAPGTSFLGAPVYWALRLLRGGAGNVDNALLLHLLRVVLCALPTLLLLRPLRRHAARLCGDVKAADAAVLTYALGSMGFTYSLLLFSHQLSANLALAAFLAIERSRRSERPAGWHALAGLSAGYAVVTEYTLAPVAVLLALYAAATARSRLAAIVAIAAGALPCVLLLGAYHQAAYGKPWATGYAYVQNKTFASWHAQGFMGLSWPRLSSLAGNLFAASRGLFAYSPGLLVAFWGLVALRRQATEQAALVGALVGLYLFVAASFLYEAWGWMLGPRHLVPLMPFLVLPLACGLALMRTRSPRTPGWNLACGAAAGLCASSILVTGLCTAVFPHIPEEFTSGFAHLVWPLVKGGHVARHLLSRWTAGASPLSWMPWAGALAAMALAAFGRVLERPRWWPAVAVGLLAMVIHVGLLFTPARTPAEQKTLAWIEANWEPRPR